MTESRPVLAAVAEAVPPAAAAVVPPVASPAPVTEAPAPRAVDIPDPLASDRAAVNAVLATYRKSYNDLDARSVAAIWKGVNTNALQRAFAGLSRQNLSFERCDVRVSKADRATARCNGVLSYVPKFGDTMPRQSRLTWTITLHRATDQWSIADVRAE